MNKVDLSKERTKEEMTDNNIEWSYSNYRRYTQKKRDLKRRPPKKNQVQRNLIL